MKKLYLYINDSVSDPYTYETVCQNLNSGVLTENTLFYDEHTGEWKPLSTLFVQKYEPINPGWIDAGKELLNETKQFVLTKVHKYKPTPKSITIPQERKISKHPISTNTRLKKLKVINSDTTELLKTMLIFICVFSVIGLFVVLMFLFPRHVT